MWSFSIRLTFYNLLAIYSKRKFVTSCCKFEYIIFLKDCKHTCPKGKSKDSKVEGKRGRVRIFVTIDQPTSLARVDSMKSRKPLILGSELREKVCVCICVRVRVLIFWGHIKHFLFFSLLFGKRRTGKERKGEESEE